MSTPQSEPVELQAFTFRTLRDAVAPYLPAEGVRVLEETWLTKVLPGPARYAAFDDGDWAAVWAELHDLRRLFMALSKRDNPPAATGRRPIVKPPSDETATHTLRSSPRGYTGPAD